MKEVVLHRVRVREPEIESEIAEELFTTAFDRVRLRGGFASDVPESLTTTLVEIVVALYRKRFYEGISEERTGDFNVKFVDDVVAQFAFDIEKAKELLKDDQDKLGKVRFL